MSLADERRAIRAGITASRQGTGEAERKATGKRLEAERRGTAVVEDLNRLVQQPAPRRTLRPVAPVGALAPATGRGNYTPPPAPTGGGIASPLEETDVTLRTYWPNGYVSSDGLFTLPAPRKIMMIDADGAEVEFNYADPVPLP